MEYKPQDLSPIPIVDLAKIEIPTDGWATKRNSYCNKKFRRGDTCRKFYESLSQRPASTGFVQCPFGFSCYMFSLAGRPFALTGFIPAPRQGGDDEKARAKAHPETKISSEEVRGIANRLSAAEEARINLIAGSLKAYPAALHEIRKYNRTIKQESERLCREESPSDPDKANTRLVNIFKCSELMTLQFEVLELIANQSLVDLPMNCESEIYKIFHKSIRIYQETAAAKKVTLRIEGDSFNSRVNDKTFPIIATVLLENAIKYSLPGTEVLVRLQQLKGNRGRIEVNNLAQHVKVIPDIFAKGVRGSEDGTGMGYGLFLAQLVAKQHSTEIKYNRIQYRAAANVDNYIFWIELITVPS